MDGYNHYIRINEAGTIVYGFSTAFEHPAGNDILLLEDGPRHFQQAFHEPLINERGQYRFRWGGGEIVERTAEELAAEQPAVTKTLEQEFAELKQVVADLASLQLGV
ncbi:hypothetical protein BBD42_30845 [Paenibacillus sp. BIHB 4019]|uniref:Uncharacterized protein n=1 Tax=Paenibacillus sp. BIHB 4019 TaxID=1870819 RepID=A0A1B2DRS7_9BACL|nr:hypothetical protein [Paenibacillus sp. BIHB 4019]ANY70405.1 hypothetical protein BBD42_30845 [Paenibacillus sp. BIHB 4019]